MKALINKTIRTGLVCLLILSGYALDLQAQTEEGKTVTITITSKDADGNTFVEKMVKTGAEAADEAIDKIVQDALKAEKAIDIEVEQTEVLEGGKGITKTIERFANRENTGTEGEMEIEIELDEEGNIASEKVIEKEIHIIKADGKNEEEIQKMLEEYGINLDDMEGEKKEVRIIKMKVDSEEDIDLDKILEEQGINLNDQESKEKKVRIIKRKVDGEEEIDIDKILKEEGIQLDQKTEGQQKRVRIIKTDKVMKTDGDHAEHTVIKISDTEEVEENVMIFEDENGTRKVIKTKKGEKVNWTQLEDIEEKIKKMGIVLPTPAPPVANYVNAVRSDKLIFLAGKGPNKPEGGYVTGKVGRDLSVKEGYEAARLAGIIQLAALKAEIGDLNRVKRIVKVLGMVNATADFTDHPEVINGFSDLMVEVFGDRGKHARAAVGMYSLPRNIAVEVEMVVEIE